jgi:hypothetical protein
MSQRLTRERRLSQNEVIHFGRYRLSDPNHNPTTAVFSPQFGNTYRLHAVMYPKTQYPTLIRSRVAERAAAFSTTLLCSQTTLALSIEH